MSTVAACLKVQIGDQPIEIKDYIGSMDNYAYILPDDINVEQALILSFLSEYFFGTTSWFQIMPFTPTIMPEGSITITKIGRMIDDSLDGGVVVVGSESGSGLPPDITLSGYDDTIIKETAKYDLIGVGLPLNWLDLISDTPASELQNLIDEVGVNEINLEIHNTPITLKIHRCTQSDIDDLFRGDHSPHVDMFDSAKEMLVGINPDLSGRGLLPAYYDESNDVIVLRSDYYVTFEESFMEVE